VNINKWRPSVFSYWKGTPSALRKMIHDTKHSSVELLKRAANQNHVRRPKSLGENKTMWIDMRSPPPGAGTSKVHVAYPMYIQSAGNTKVCEHKLKTLSCFIL